MFAKEKGRSRFQCQDVYLYENIALYAHIRGGGFLLSEFTTIKITEIMPIVVQAPLKFAVDVVMVAMADFLLFKQKITKIQFAQIGLALISGVLFVL